MKSNGLGGYLSLINTKSPKTHQNFSFSDTECNNQSTTDSSDEETEASIEAVASPIEAENGTKSKKRFKVFFQRLNLGYVILVRDGPRLRPKSASRGKYKNDSLFRHEK